MEIEEDMKTKCCEYPGCNEPAQGIARRKYLCKYHYKKIKKQNISIFNHNKDIPLELI